MTEEPAYYVVRDQAGTVVEVLDGNDACLPYRHGDYYGHCGGCGSCLLQQAKHAGGKVERLVQRPFETVGDAVGRLTSETGEDHA